MKGIRDWIFAQLSSSNSLDIARPLMGGGRFFPERNANDDSGGDHSTHPEATMPPLSATSQPSDISQMNGPHPSSQQAVQVPDRSNNCTDEKGLDLLAKTENLRITLFRVLLRFRLPQDNVLVLKVLYRLHLATLIRAGESDLKRVRKDRARTLAAEQEASGRPELNFSLRVLVLGKTGVGKSATINSIFDQTKTLTDAFRPGTDHIHEIMGTINGIKVTFIDTPGFLPSSSCNLRRNRKIMLSVKRFIRKSPPDIVLFFERLDLINLGYSDFPLLKLMTDIFGTAIWFNTTLVLTHASSNLPEELSGRPVSYESYVTQRSNLMQHHIHQAITDSRIENPVLLVENHRRCRKNSIGEAILPNGQVWRSEFMLLSVCSKILGDANSLLKFQDSIELGPSAATRVPSLPHLLSSFLQHRSLSPPREATDQADEIFLSNSDEEDEYDRLPPIRILTKSQFRKLTNAQKKDYLDEVDYRETLYLKKQLKEECRNRRKKKLLKGNDNGEDNNSNDQQATPEAVLLPDMAVPPSFDSDYMLHRYRCLVTSDQWLVRPVLDPQGWDHDVGFDGVNLETTAEINGNVFASISGQMRKDKQDFSIQSECATAYAESGGPTYALSFDVQSAGKDLIYIVHANTKLRILRNNVTDCGASLTSFGKRNYVGVKVEDTVLVGKRLKLVFNAGQITGPSEVAYGGSFEATLRGNDYPVRNDNVTLSLSALNFNKEMVLVGGIQSEFRPCRGMHFAVNANINSQKMGKISLKMNSSEHLQIALIAVFTIFKTLLRRKTTQNINSEMIESG
ncbi:hypothetical protein K2173_017633 [Erythroxylum novogranatense]|uniref:AIG1-type G domain-containing protein n=1 Tax=Erythroxylum novogranatense TaxID=1862640 RepID=A0AAV8SM10_9ROSI|nr:hypothetical protein K2173_017633 [Erythroxylum novogranatense]